MLPNNNFIFWILCSGAYCQKLFLKIFSAKINLESTKIAFHSFKNMKASSVFAGIWYSNEVLLDLTMYCLQDKIVIIPYLDQEKKWT